MNFPVYDCWEFAQGLDHFYLRAGTKKACKSLVYDFFQHYVLGQSVHCRNIGYLDGMYYIEVNVEQIVVAG